MTSRRWPAALPRSSLARRSNTSLLYTSITDTSTVWFSAGFSEISLGHTHRNGYTTKDVQTNYIQISEHIMNYQTGFILFLMDLRTELKRSKLDYLGFSQHGTKTLLAEFSYYYTL